MQNKVTPDFFDKTTSENYDERNKKTGAIMDNLHFLIKLILKDLPSASKILCVGVGTGTEILELAQAFPKWRFTGIDPSAPMLDVCRERLQKQGLLDRCELLHGRLADFSDAEEFDGVLCLLVAHFITDMPERQQLFDGMAKRLKPNGYLINAEISYDLATPQFESIVETWKAMHKFAGASEEKAASLPQILKQVLAVLPPAETERLLHNSGFQLPVRFFQSLLIHAWYSQK